MKKLHYQIIFKTFLILCLVLPLTINYDVKKSEAAEIHRWNKYDIKPVPGYVLRGTLSQYDGSGAKLEPTMGYSNIKVDQKSRSIVLYNPVKCGSEKYGYEVKYCYYKGNYDDYYSAEYDNKYWREYYYEIVDGTYDSKGDTFLGVVTSDKITAYPHGDSGYTGYFYEYLGKDNVPTIQLSSPNNQILSTTNGYNTFSISGTTQDADAGDQLSIKYQIDSNAPQTVQTLTSNGSNQFFGPISITMDPNITEGSHTIKVWTEDKYNVPSNIEVRNFSIDRTAPSVPTLSLWNKSETSIGLTWSAANDASGILKYDIYNGPNYVGTTQSTTFIVNNLLPSNSYQFTVKSIDNVGNVSTSNSLNVITPDLTPPSAPKNLRALNFSGTGVDLLWDASTDNVGVTGYDIYNGTTLIGSTTNETKFRINWSNSRLKSVTNNVYGLNSVTNITYNPEKIASVTESTYRSLLATGLNNYNITVKAKDAAGNISGPSNVVLVEQTDGNDSFQNATAVNYKQTISAGIDYVGDVDYFKYTATANGLDEIILEVPTDKNYSVYVYDQNQKVLVAGLGEAGQIRDVLIKVKQNQTYYIKIESTNGEYGINPYVLTLNKYQSSYKTQTTYEYDKNGNLKKKETKTIVE